jgi:hypothetical protein
LTAIDLLLTDELWYRTMQLLHTYFKKNSRILIESRKKFHYLSKFYYLCKMILMKKWRD